MRVRFLGERGSWRIGLPAERLIDAHLTLLPAEPDGSFGVDSAADLLAGYRAATSALQRSFGATGFMITFALRWRPYGDGVGEPAAIDGYDCAVHVFGRRPGEPLSPVRAMAVPEPERVPLPPEPAVADRLRPLLDGPPSPLTVEGPVAEPCDGCKPSVLTEQERWRADGVRVIRPQRGLIDPQVLLLPLRHVVSLRDLDPAEVVSLAARLGEVLRQFRLASGSTGLTGFANDGVAARQETPHVHLHVYGRSAAEPVNPYDRLAALLPKPQRPV